MSRAMKQTTMSVMAYIYITGEWAGTQYVRYMYHKLSRICAQQSGEDGQL